MVEAEEGIACNNRQRRLRGTPLRSRPSRAGSGRLPAAQFQLNAHIKFGATTPPAPGMAAG